MTDCKPSEERHRIAVGGRWSAVLSDMEWLRGNGTFIGFQGTLPLCAPLVPAVATEIPVDASR